MLAFVGTLRQRRCYGGGPRPPGLCHANQATGGGGDGGCGHIPLISLYRSQDEDDDGVTRGSTSR